MTDEETELRVLLERVVPHLPAPAQRWERVRERVRRRRRRRAVALSATAVLAVAAAGLLLPGAGGPSGAPAPGRITSLAPPASGAVPTGGPPTSGPPTPASTSTSDAAVDQHPSRVHTFAALTGLTLGLPPGWRTLTPHGSRTVYVSSQALGLPPGGCAHPLDDFCTPLVRRLTPGGVLIKLELNEGKLSAEKFRLLPRTAGAEQVVPACRTVGGTAQLGTTIVDGTGSALVMVTVCLSDPVEPQESRVRDLLMAADFR